jgi:hypothetical protein
MQSRTVIPFLASLALSASAALAQDAPPAPPAAQTMESAHDPMRGPMHMNKEEFAKHHAQMCSDRFAHDVGDLAYLETKLALGDKQRVLFDRWRNVKLASAKVRAAECAALKLPDKEPFIVEHLKQEEKMLQHRLDDLRAELPTLEALTASLNDEQKHAFAPRHPGFGPEGPRRGLDGHPFGGGGPGAGPDGDIPPPPPAD